MRCYSGSPESRHIKGTHEPAGMSRKPIESWNKAETESNSFSAAGTVIVIVIIVVAGHSGLLAGPAGVVTRAFKRLYQVIRFSQ